MLAGYSGHKKKITEKFIASPFLMKFGSFSWSFLDQAMVSSMNFVSGILLAKLLGLGDYGRFSLAWMIVLFASSIQLALLISPMMSIGPKLDREQGFKFYGAVFIHQIIFSVIAFFLVFIFVRFNDYWAPEWGIKNLALPMAFVTTNFINQDFVRKYFFTVNKVKKAFVIDLVSYAGQVILLIGFAIFTNLDLEDTLWIIGITSAASVLIGCFFFNEISFSKSEIIPVFIRNWDSSKWLLFTSILQWTSGNYFSVVAASLLGTTAAGAIKVVKNIVGIIHILFLTIENIAPRRAAIAFKERGAKDVFRFARSMFIWGGIGTALSAAVIYLFPDFWLGIFYGNEFLAFSTLLRGYSLFYVVVFLSYPLRTVLRTFEKTQVIFVAYILSTIISLLLATPMVETLGLFGVIVGQVIVQLVMMLCYATVYYQIMKERLR